MLLTLYYMAATCLQWYRLGRMRNQLTQSLAICAPNSCQNATDLAPNENGPLSSEQAVNDQSGSQICEVAPALSKGIIFYRGVYDGTATENQKLGDLLCYQEDRRACTVIPQKRVNLTEWICFPRGHTLFPLEVGTTDIQRVRSPSKDAIYLLLHTGIQRATNIDELHSIQIENVGIPLAWRTDTQMSLVIQSDIQSLTSLATAFMSRPVVINDSLELKRIETISVEGRPYDLSPSDITPGMLWARHAFCGKQWSVHVVQLKSLSATVTNRIHEDANKLSVSKIVHRKKSDKHKSRKDDLRPVKSDNKKLKDNSAQVFESSKKLATSKSSLQNIEATTKIECQKTELKNGSEEVSEKPVKVADSIVENTSASSVVAADNEKAEVSDKNAPKTDKTDRGIIKYLKPHRKSSECKLEKQKSFEKSPEKRDKRDKSSDKLEKRDKSTDKREKRDKSTDKLEKSPEKSSKRDKSKDKRDKSTEKERSRYFFRSHKHSDKEKREKSSEKNVDETSRPEKKLERHLSKLTRHFSKEKDDNSSNTSEIPELHSKSKSQIPKETSSNKLSETVDSSSKTESKPSKTKESELVSKSSEIPKVSTNAMESASKLSLASTATAEAFKAALPEININDKKVDKSMPAVKKIPFSMDSQGKPPNVLIYADSAAARESVKAALDSILHRDKYTIYTLSPTSNWWGSKATLLVVCGAVVDRFGPLMLDYLLAGGKMLCLCSDFLNTVLPTFTTAEVRERELVRFTYDRWHRVRMIHHIFCYQPSPGRKLFSSNSDEVSPNSTRCGTPTIFELKDSSGKSHSLEVQILGFEDTWHTPSLILATIPDSKGRAVFSQVHLELEPSQYESDEDIYKALCETNSVRLDILRHILDSHLGMDCSHHQKEFQYVAGYFLGSHELKLAMIANIQPKMTGNILKLDQLKIQFCGKGVTPSPATTDLLPILIHCCPTNFSTVTYFETLKTKHIGRLVMYVDVITSSMNVLNGGKLEHGLVIVPRHQTQGSGRGGNAWLSPEGCAMFSVQMHIPRDTTLGQRAPLVQLLVAVAVVSAIKSNPGYEKIDIGLKWPNDIYVRSKVKIGGLIINSIIEPSMVICNIGLGVNLDNSNPTTCINDLIAEFNSANNTNLPRMTIERFLALVFNEMERIYGRVIGGDIDYLYEKYYEYWLHSDAEITVLSKDGASQQATVVGVDDFGYLEVKSEGKKFSVHPDGNTFDMLVGLVAPKLR